MPDDGFAPGARRSTTCGPTLRPMETDAELLTRLRAGDAKAFMMLVGRYNGSLQRLARAYVPSDACRLIPPAVAFCYDILRN